MKIAGIDYSMLCPCVAVFDGNPTDFCLEKCHFHYLTNTKKCVGLFDKNIRGYWFDHSINQIERFSDIGDWALNHIKDCSQILMEGFSMGSKGKVFNIAENAGILKYKMYVSKLHFDSLPPTVLKKFATTKGNADKKLMYDSFTKETKCDLMKVFSSESKNIGNPISDIVDAYYLVKYLAQHPLE